MKRLATAKLICRSGVYPYGYLILEFRPIQLTPHWSVPSRVGDGDTSYVILKK